MKLTSATYETGSYGEPATYVNVKRQGDAIVVNVNSATFRFRAADMQETDLNQDTWTELVAFAISIYGESKKRKGFPACTNSMLQDLRGTLEAFA